jgi:hypothetical protein
VIGASRLQANADTPWNGCHPGAITFEAEANLPLMRMARTFEGDQTMRQAGDETNPTSGRDPAEGRSDMELPGADRAKPISDRAPGDAPHAPGDDLPQRLGERIQNEPGTGIGGGEPDLVPDVEVPEETM